MSKIESIKLTIASPEEILRWSHGEVIKPETINYRTQRSEKDGLFSERIFGPTKDWECYCGKYRRIRYKGITCDKCGVEVTRSIVRRDRMGHITLASPVAHIWFLRSIPSKISILLNVPAQKLEKVIYYASYIVTSVNEENRKRALQEIGREFKMRTRVQKKEGKDAGAGKKKKKDEPKDEEQERLEAAMHQTKNEIESLSVGIVLSETQYYNLSRRFGDVFTAGIGAEAIRKILEEIDLKKDAKYVEVLLEKTKDANEERKLSRRLKILRAMSKNNLRPEWMVLTVIPILPPDLRPMVALDGGRYATSDLNDLYRRVINRNNRLKKLLELRAPEIIITNEKRMLQEAVDALIDNAARFGAQQMSNQRRPLRSLAEMLKGKQGRFRQNLLGKRVDYSGRSVIVIGPNLKIDQCGLPKKMALELFKPFVIGRILADGLAYNIRNANRLIDQAPAEVWAILEDVIKNKKVLLNRAPTLHRLSVQAFRPVLIEGLAIQLPALVCTAFNADFDGDQMAVHLPLSDAAQEEATNLMLASKNILKPATGDPVVAPGLDMVLGCHYLTKILKGAKGAGMIFADEEEALIALAQREVALNAEVIVRIKRERITTSCGRIIFSGLFPKEFRFINETMTKKIIGKLIGEVVDKYGIDSAHEVIDDIKATGFEYATQSGITWSMSDLITPERKPDIINGAEKEAQLIHEQYNNGVLTAAERRARIISIWEAAKMEIAEVVPSALAEDNSIYLIIDSGSRGSWSQPIQMAGMKGLVQNSQGETIELPIKSSLKEGLNVLEYFISTHGARKGTTDTALKTAQAGYLTRRLVDVSQDLIVRGKDCRTKEGIQMVRSDGDEFNHSFASRLFSRTTIEDIKDGRKIIVRAGEIITVEHAQTIEESGVEVVLVRSPITCKILYGICSACYGLDLGANKLVETGTPVGVIAAQSIGEPGTQLTMRTFHAGGIAGVDITHGLPRVDEIFEVRPPKGKAILAQADGTIESIEERGALKIVTLKTIDKKSKLINYSVSRSATLFKGQGDMVEKGDQLSEGNIDLKELFEWRGMQDVWKYIANEVQRIYVSEGAVINNKHIEVIIRQMFARVRIKNAGDSDFVNGEITEKSMFLEANRALRKEGSRPATAVQLLMGITKASLSTDSFLSAASFQETARVLVNAAIEGKVDKLRGLKENVIIGQLIPVGTGLKPPAQEKNE